MITRIGGRAAICCLTVIALAGPSARALVVPVSGGRSLGMAPRSPAALTQAWWQAGGLSAASPVLRAEAFNDSYEQLIERYLGDVAHDSGTNANVYGVAAQYGDANHFLGLYASSFAGEDADTDPYPANGAQGNAGGCVPGPARSSSPPYTSCLTDNQIRAELQGVIGAHAWPTNLSAIYFVLLPPGTDVCAGAGPRANGNPCADTDFCAYHASFGPSGTPAAPVYAVIPYAGVAGCVSGQEPNGDPADGAINLISHEHSETITDPLGNAWHDGRDFEIADKCADLGVFGSPLGGSPGSLFNQVINGHLYYLQDEFSNADGRTCEQRLGGHADGVSSSATNDAVVYGGGPIVGAHATHVIFWGPPPAPRAQGPLAAAQSVSDLPLARVLLPANGHQAEALTFDASGSADPQGEALAYAWSFGDGVTGSGATVKHTYWKAGPRFVHVTVTNASGNQTAAGGTVRIVPSPEASFTAPARPVRSGRAVSFDASSSFDPYAPIVLYSWDFGDGGAATGVTSHHAYASAGRYLVRLRIEDRGGRVVVTSHQVDVQGRLVPHLEGRLTAHLVRLGRAAGEQGNGAGVGVATGESLVCPRSNGGSCQASATATTSATPQRGATAQGVTVGSGALRLGAGRRTQLVLQLNSGGLARLDRHRELSLSVAIGVRTGHGHQAHLSLYLRVKKR